MSTKQEVLDAAGYVGRRGRPAKIKESSHARNIRISDSSWDKIPGEKSENVRIAIDFALLNGVFDQ